MARVVVIGGGLAGLAAAQRAAELGHKVLLLESRNRLGGRAGSFVDANTAQVIDTCQHVSMGCCNNLAHFYRTIGVQNLLAPQRELWFQTPDGKMSRFTADRLPAPLHLARSFLRLHFLSFIDKLKIAYALTCLRFATTVGDENFLQWLRRHHQSQRVIDRFWSVVLVSALNETIDRIGIKYARKVFVDAFMADRRGFEVQIPTVPLDRLYGEEMQLWFADRGVEIRWNAGVKSIAGCPSTPSGQSGVRITLRHGEEVDTDWCVAAVPFDRLLELLPEEVVRSDAAFRRLSQLQTSPIVSVHLWFDRPVLQLPHVVLVDCLGQWVFNRGEIAPGEWYIQVVISAARDLVKLENDVIAQKIIVELKLVLPRAGAAKRLRYRVVREHAATISVGPGVDELRPGPRCSIPNLLLAGDWTNTGWPGTMEGAVISGYRAAAELANEEPA